ncbi:MAG: DUF3566 domain-containing protein [Actinomycetota bacterium]|nr:DUF3566 domain-containing protein [Actinomycetota bacterium]
MTDKTPSKSGAPDSDGADDSPTAEMPRVPRSDRDPDAAETKSNPNATKTISDVLAGKKGGDGSGSKDSEPTDKAADEPVGKSADEAKTNSPPVAESKPSDDARNSPAAREGTKGGFAGRLSAAVPSSLRNPKPVVKTSPGSAANTGSTVGRFPGAGTRPGSGQTESATPPATPPAKAPASPAAATGAAKTEGVTPVSRPMTAGEYARTTNPSPSTTAVIPAVRDEPRPSTGAAAAATAASGRQASLKLVRVDPWSVTKVAFALSVALMIVAVVAMTILWIVLSFAGVWDQINSSVTTVLSDDSNSFDITDYLGLGRIVGLTLVIAAINVVITTAVATIGAYLYNLAAQLLGGVDITLAEDD